MRSQSVYVLFTRDKVVIIVGQLFHDGVSGASVLEFLEEFKECTHLNVSEPIPELKFVEELREDVCYLV